MLPGLPILVLLLLLAAAPPTAARPQKIVSIGLCTDQLLLLLAEREQIASLSWLARDRELSYLAGRVGEIPLNTASAEDVIRFDPDLVVTSDFAARDTVRMLRRLGYRVEQLPVATSLAQLYRLLRDFGDWTGNPARAQRVVADMRRELERIRRRYASRPSKSVIVYSPNGFTVGAKTLEHDMLVMAGYRNLAADMGIEGFRPISLERLVASNPDVLQIDRGLAPQDSLATAYLGHPVLRKLDWRQEDLDIPARLRICAGPMITEAIESMAARR